MLIDPWQEQFGFNFNQKMAQIVNDAYSIEKVLFHNKSQQNKFPFFLNANFLNNSLICIKKKILYHMHVFEQLSLLNDPISSELTNLLEQITLQIKENNIGEEYRDPNNKCRGLINTISNWQQTALQPFIEQCITPYYIAQEKISNEKLKLRCQRNALTKIIRGTIQDYNLHLETKYPHEPNKSFKKFWRVFDGLAGISCGQVDIIQKYNEPETRLKSLIKVINLIFSRAQASIRTSSKTLSSILLINIQKNFTNSKIELSKTLLGINKASLTEDHQVTLLSLKDSFQLLRTHSKESSNVKRQLLNNIRLFELTLNNLKKYLFNRQRNATESLLKAYEMQLSEAQHQLSIKYPCPFIIKRTKTILSNRKVNDFDEKCSQYFIKIKTILMQEHLFTKTQAPILLPIYSLFAKFDALSIGKSKEQEIKNNFVGLILLKKIINTQFNLLNSNQYNMPNSIESYEFINIINDLLSANTDNGNSFSALSFNHYYQKKLLLQGSHVQNTDSHTSTLEP